MTAGADWDKLSIINEALLNTGNATVVVEDGTTEWTVCSSAFDQWLKILLYRRDWPFATRTVALDRTGDSLYPGYQDIFAKPADCLFLMNVWRTDLAKLVLPAVLGLPSERDNTRPPALDYRIMGDAIHTVAEQGAMVLYVPAPFAQQPLSVGFVAALRLRVEATIYKSLHEDFAEADRAEKMADAAMEEAASRADNEQPRSVAFRSNLVEARRMRRYGGQR